jgi:hypothetical protein
VFISFSYLPYIPSFKHKMGSYYQYPPAYAAQPLQPPYNFTPTEFYNLSQYATQQPNTNTTPYRVAPIIATYANQTQRLHAINNAYPEDRQQYTAGMSVNSATRYYPSGIGGVGMVTSSLQNTTQASNDWHTVGVLRHGQTVWVHDPQYVPGSQTRLPMIPGTANVTRLLNSPGFGAVNQVQVQGLAAAPGECMGRTAQWVDNVISAPGALAPYQPGHFIPGQVNNGWQVVQRY